MHQDPIIFEGITLMALGMGFVFCFLCLLVGAIRLLTNLASRFEPPPVKAAAPAAKNVHSDDNLVAAISAALHHHKKKYS